MSESSESTVPVASSPLLALPVVLPRRWIADHESLRTCCERWLQVDYLTIDTEFERTKTFYPQLALIQVCDGNSVALIDAQAITDWQFFNAVLQSNIPKIMHAAGEDLETLFHTCGVAPCNVIDSQSALALLNRGVSVGYAALVAEYFGVSLSKELARTDWLARPLSDAQLDYAAADVSYLFFIWPHLDAALQTQDRKQCLQQESALSLTKATCVEDETTAYQRVKQAFVLSGKSLAVAASLAQWREVTARTKNVARGQIVKDDALIVISQKQPKSRNALADLNVLHPSSLRRFGDDLIKQISISVQIPEEQYPSSVLRINDMPSARALAQLFTEQVAAIAVQKHIAPEFLFSRRNTEQLAMAVVVQAANRDRDAKPFMWTHWRREWLKKGFELALNNLDLEQPVWW